MFLLKFLVLNLLQGFFVAQAESSLPAAVKYALASSFNNTANELNIVVETDFDKNKQFFLDTINTILKENWNFRLVIHVNQQIIQQSGDYNLWFIDSYEGFMRLLPWIHAYHSDSQLYFFIVLRTSLEKIYYIHEIEKIFSDFFQLMIANVNVIVETASEGVLFYTFFPYQELECRSTKPLLTHHFNTNSNSIKIEDQFFPSKADNFRGCPLRVITRNELMLNLANYEKPKALVNYEMSILEVIIFKELASRMNFSTEVLEFTFLESPDSELPITTNGKIDVLLGFVRNSPSRNYLYSKGQPYYLSWIVIAFYPELNKFRSEAWFLAPFNFITWICIFAFISLIYGCIIFTNTLRAKRKFGGLDIISLIIGASIQHLPGKNCFRFALIALSLGALVLRTAYLGKLYDAFRGQKILIPPRNLNELFAEDYTIYADSYYKHIIDELKEIDYQNIQPLDRRRTKNFEPFGADKKKAIVTSFIYVYTYFSAEERMKIWMEKVIGEQICMFFQRHSFILPKINEITVRLEEAGILHYFRRGFEILNDSKFLEGKVYREPKALGFESFACIIYLGILLYGISCLVFIIELLWYKMKKRYLRVRLGFNTRFQINIKNLNWYRILRNVLRK